MDFTVVDGDYDNYQKIKELYIKTDLTYKQIAEKVGLSKDNVARIIGSIIRDTGYSRNRVRNDEMKHIYRLPSGYYRISKMINGKNTHYGHFRNDTVAMKIKKLWESVDWDKSRINEIQKEIILLR